MFFHFELTQKESVVLVVFEKNSARNEANFNLHCIKLLIVRYSLENPSLFPTAFRWIGKVYLFRLPCAIKTYNKALFLFFVFHCCITVVWQVGRAAYNNYFSNERFHHYLSKSKVCWIIAYLFHNNKQSQRRSSEWIERKKVMKKIVDSFHKFTL